MYGCSKCSKAMGWSFLIAAVLFLLVNLTTWDLWGIEWYTVLFIILALGGFGHGSCKVCQGMKK